MLLPTLDPSCRILQQGYQSFILISLQSSLRWQLKVFSRRKWFHLLLLLVWCAVGTGLRFSHLTTKPFWTDEFSTLVFSLGNSFRTVPLDQVISAEVLLGPLQPNSQAGVGAVIDHLLSESNHPPVYFVLTHLWLQLFSLQNSRDLAWAGRSLSALLGAASIPAMFGLGWLAFRSRLVGQIAAAMIAVSPYGIYLAQEARHYTLAVLGVVASLCCLIVATRAIQDRKPLPGWVGLTWVGVNCLGIASHYFFALTLCAEALVLVAQACQGQQGAWFYWRRIWAVALGTFCGGLVWLPVWQKTYGSELTQWIYRSDRLGLAWLEPVYQTLAWMITMLALPPVQASNQGVVIVSGVSLVIFMFWALPMLWRGLRTQQAHQPNRLATQVLGGFTLGAIAVFFGFTYGLNTDLTSASRYSFVYFPAVIALVGASLAICWNGPPRTTTSQPGRLQLLSIGGKQAVVLIWLVGLLSSLTVVGDLGYQKTHRPELVVQTIQQVSQAPVLIAIAHRTHGQTGRMIGLAWEFNRQDSGRDSGKEMLSPADSLKGGFPEDRPGAPARWPYQFLLAHQDQDPQTAISVLQQALTELPRPLDLWLVNFPVQVEPSDCTAVQAERSQVDGYELQLYHCQRH